MSFFSRKKSQPAAQQQAPAVTVGVSPSAALAQTTHAHQQSISQQQSQQSLQGSAKKDDRPVSRDRES